MKILKRRSLNRFAACLLATMVVSTPATADAGGLAEKTLETLDTSLSKAFARPMHGEILYQDQQPIALTIGISYSFPAAERGAQWAESVTRLLREMGAVHVQVSDSEVRGEKLPIADRQAVATHFNATPLALEVVVIFLEP